MARIRTIKPEFWTNDKILSISALTRLMFIGMWNFADDYGRMDFAPISIKARIFPTDATTVTDVQDMLNELCSHDLIMIYSANDKEYIEITGWDHQKIDRRQPSKIPAPFADGSVIRGIPPTPADSSPTPSPVMEGKGEEGKGEERKEETRANALSFCDPPDFDEFWAYWPNKVGRRAAVKAYASAMKRGARPSEILEGIQSYIRDKPPDRPWLNPATFLNQNRWEDRPAATAAPRASTVYQQRQQESKEVFDALRQFNARAGDTANPGVLRRDTSDGPDSIRGGADGNLVRLPASGRGSGS